MRIKSDQLGSKLKQNLAPLYVVFGDEPLQVGECCDAIRACARASGFSEREVFSVDGSFDWNSLVQSANSMSLFAEQRILDVRMPTSKPGTQGAKILEAYAQDLPADTLTLLSCGKVDARSQKSKWFKALENVGVVVPVWPVDANRMPNWVESRMQQRGLVPEQGVATVLAERVEGNLLAAAQEIDKLALLYGQGKIGVDQVLASVSDSARFDIFELVDCALSGQTRRAQRMLHGLRSEGEPPTLVLWAITKEVRELLMLAYDVAAGQAIGQAMAQRRVWDKRKGPVGKGLQRYRPQHWQSMLKKCAQIDRMIKGLAAGDVWDELLQLLLQMGGVWAPGAGLKSGAEKGQTNARNFGR